MDSIKEKWLWLATLPSINSSKITSLLNKFDSIDEIYEAEEKDFQNIDLIHHSDISYLCDKSMERSKEVYNRTVSSGGYILCIDDEDYPEKLKQLQYPPYVLYLKGTFSLSQKSVCVGIVGTRNFNEYGRVCTEKIAFEIAKAGCTIISGMARGIDTFSQVSALRAGSPTVAVLGCGIDIVYPHENGKIMDSIVNNGLLVSEYPPLTPPYRTNFPERNRIIAALSDSLLVTQAPLKSGALITAREAFNLGKTIFTIPANIFDPDCAGNNVLLKSGALVASHPRDIIDFHKNDLIMLEPVESKSINIEYPKKENRIKTNSDDRKENKEDKKNKEENKVSDVPQLNRDTILSRLTTDDEKLIAGFLFENGKTSVDEIIRATKLDTKAVNSVLPLMEISGIVTKHPGNFYEIKK